MGYVRQTYNSRVELGQKLATAFTNMGATVLLQEQTTDNGEPGYVVIVQIASDVFVRYHFLWYLWYSRRSTTKYVDAVFTQMGTSYDSATKALSGQVSGNVGTNQYAYTSSERVHQTVPIPGNLHAARNPTTGEVMFALETPADSLTAVHGVARLAVHDATFGHSTQWMFDGEYSYRDANSYDRVPFGHNPSSTRAPTRSGVIQTRDSNGVVTGYSHLGNRQAGVTGVTWSGFLPVGPYGTYEAIKNNLSFAPSLTNIFLPYLWRANPERNKSTGTPRAEAPSLRICNMKQLGVGQKLVYNNQEWRVFPAYGKGGTETVGIAINVGAAS